MIQLLWKWLQLLPRRFFTGCSRKMEDNVASSYLDSRQKCDNRQQSHQLGRFQMNKMARKYHSIILKIATDITKKVLYEVQVKKWVQRCHISLKSAGKVRQSPAIWSIRPFSNE